MHENSCRPAFSEGRHYCVAAEPSEPSEASDFGHPGRNSNETKLSRCLQADVYFPRILPVFGQFGEESWRQ